MPHRKARRRHMALPLVRIYSLLLLTFSVYTLLDTFVITRSYARVSASETVTSAVEGASTGAQGQVEGESNDNAGDSAATNAAASSQVQTSLAQYRYADTTVYVVDVYTNDVTQLLAAFAQDTYGKNVTAKTSQMATAVGATVAINGDYYGARNAGYVVRNGVLYRSEAASASQEDLVIYADGTFEVICEGSVDAQALVDAGAWQVFSFGPGLVSEGAVTVDADDEVGRAMASNPRTAVGKVADGHYVLVVSDGRTSESEGLTLQELATFMVDELGVECAYNLDGGGSSTLWYEGKVVNNPTTNGHSIKERSVSDIVYLVA